MPIYLSAYLLPRSAYIPYLLEDIYLRGGFRSLATLAQRDALKPFTLKFGCLVHVEEDDTLYRYKGPGAWEVFQAGISAEDIKQPLMIDDEGKLTVNPQALLPTGGTPGQIPTMTNDGVKWMDLELNENVGLRSSKQVDVGQIGAGETVLFEFDLAKSAMLHTLTVNAFDIEIKLHSTIDRDDLNPYTFISKPNLLTDQGIRYNDLGEVEYVNRFALLANLEAAPITRLYGTARNMGGVPVDLRVSASYLVLE